MNNYLVTGGLGFIGSHLVEELLRDQNNIVWIVDDGSNVSWNPQKGRIGPTDIRSILVQLMEGYQRDEDPTNPRLIIMSGDCAHRNILTRVRAGMFQCVFHLAADVSVVRSIEEPITCLKQNVEKSLQIARACAEGNTRLVFSSSAAVYGNLISTTCHESYRPFPTNPYGLTKYTVEEYLRVYRELYDLDYVNLRYFNVYGPRQLGGSPYAGVIGNWIHNMYWKKPIKIEGDGKQTRDFVFVKDIATANIKAASAELNTIRTFNICTGIEKSLKFVYNFITKNIEHDMKYVPTRKGDIYSSVGDTGMANAMLQWRANTSLEAGLTETLKWRGLI